jgi:ADP-heptose:LPS heptosyltransferase
MKGRERDPQKILVIKFGPLGEFVPALAAMRRIRQVHPKAKITLLTTPAFEALAKTSRYFNAVDTGGEPEGFGGWMALISRVRRGRYQRVYDLQTSSQTNLLFQMLRPFAPPWSGTAAGCALRHRNPRRARLHTLERHADQLKQAGVWPDAPVDSGSAPPPDLSWIISQQPDPRPVAGGVKPRPYALLVPGGQKDKRWPIQRYGELAALLRTRGFDIVVIGGPEESALARAIQRHAQARDLTGRTDFAQIAATAARAALAVGNDSGPMHLIAAAGTPTLVLFSKLSDPSLAAPRGHVSVLRSPNLNDLAVAEVMGAAQHLIPPAPGS